MSHKDSELPNSLNSFAKIDINRGLDFPHLVCTAHFGGKKCIKNISGSAESSDDKK